MSPLQTALYFREWGAVRKHYVAQGIDPKLADAKRHELHKRALGHMKSSKSFTNADLDKVLAVFRAITQPGNLTAQLRQLDQPEGRTVVLFERLRALAKRCISKPGVEEPYLSGMARKIFGEEHGYHALNETQLNQLAGVLQRQVDRIDARKREAARKRQAPGALKAFAADTFNINNCPW